MDIGTIASCLLEIPLTNHDVIIPSIGAYSYSWLYYLDKKIKEDNKL